MPRKKKTATETPEAAAPPEKDKLSRAHVGEFRSKLIQRFVSDVDVDTPEIQDKLKELLDPAWRSGVLPSEEQLQTAFPEQLERSFAQRLLQEIVDCGPITRTDLDHLAKTEDEEQSLDAELQALVEAKKVVGAEVDGEMTYVTAEPQAEAGTVVIPSAKTTGLLTRNLLHIYTAEELREKRSEREKIDADRDQVLTEIEALEVSLKPLKKRLDALTVESFELSRIVRKGKEFIEVECRDEQGPDTRWNATKPGVVGIATIRLDTNEICDWREFKASERQGALFDE